MKQARITKLKPLKCIFKLELYVGPESSTHFSFRKLYNFFFFTLQLEHTSVVLGINMQHVVKVMKMFSAFVCVLFACVFRGCIALSSQGHCRTGLNWYQILKSIAHSATACKMQTGEEEGCMQPKRPLCTKWCSKEVEL